MKKILAILCGATMMFAACTSDPTPVAPVFPKATTATVVAGEVYELPFEANLDWALSISEEAMAYFSFLGEDGLTTYNLYGVAGEYVAKIKVADTQEFDVERMCDITLTMNGEAKVICTLTRSMTERSIAVYAAAGYDSEAGDFTKDEEGAYIYSENDATELSLIYDAYNNSYKSRVKVVANCNYGITTSPAWLSFNIVDPNNTEFQEYRVLSNVEKLPFEAETKKIIFSDITDEQNHIHVKEVSVTIPGCARYLQVSLAKEMSFNAEGLYNNDGNYSELGAIARITAPMGAKVFKASKSEQGWYYADEDQTKWILLENDAWEEGASATEGIWTRTFNVLTAANDTNAAREGLLIILPQDLAASINDPSFDLFNGEGTELKEIYKEYAYTISQDAPEVKDLFSVVIATDSMETMGAEFTEAPGWANYDSDGCERGFKLLYTKEWSSDGYYLNANFEYDEIVYKAFTLPNYTYNVVSGENSWLSYDVYASGGRVTMNPAAATRNPDSGAFEGYIIFKKGGQSITYIFCEFNENATVGGGSGVAGDVVAFANPEMAMYAATLELMEDTNPLYNAAFGADYGLMGLPQYILTYNNMYGLMMPSYTALAINGFTFGQATGEYEINGEKWYGSSIFSFYNNPDMGGVIIEPNADSGFSAENIPNGNYEFTVFGAGYAPIARIVLVINIPM